MSGYSTHGAGRTSTWAHRQRRQRILARDNHQCQLAYPGICTGTATVLDHRDNTRGPNYDTDDNCQAACWPCNDHKARHEAATARGKQAAQGHYPTPPHPGLRTTPPT